MRAAIGLLVLLCGAGGCSSPPRENLGDPQGAEYVARGRMLVRGLAACGFCHGQTADPASVLVGGRTVYDRHGEAAAPNLTPHADGLAGWSAADIMIAVRSSLGRSDEPLSRDVHEGYEWMADEDLMSIAAYLKSQPPLPNRVDRRSLGFWSRNIDGYSETRDRILGYIPRINPAFPVEYGKYLTDHVARCGACHNQRGGLILDYKYLGGGETVRTSAGDKPAPGLTGSADDGLGGWSQGEIVHYLKTGERPDGGRSDPDFCPWRFYGAGEDRDLRAIAAYLKSLP